MTFDINIQYYCIVILCTSIKPGNFILHSGHRAAPDMPTRGDSTPFRSFQLNGKFWGLSAMPVLTTSKQQESSYTLLCQLRVFTYQLAESMSENQ
jgi:hypothetical protein